MSARTLMLLIAVAIGAPVMAQDSSSAPHVLIDASLNPIPVRILSISSDAVTVRTATEPLRIWRLSEVAALVVSRTGAGATLAPGAAPHTLRLRDGRVYRGELDVLNGKGASELSFRSVSIGQIAVSLEEVESIEMTGGERTAPVVTQDTLYFRNGDRASGFVEGIGGSVRLSATDGEREFELGSILAIDFANPRVRGRGFTVRTADEILACDGLNMPTSGQISILRNGIDLSEAPKIELQSILSIVPDASDIISLSDIAIASHDRTTSPPRLLTRGAVGQDIEITGPATVRWTLPTGATKIAGELTLPENCRDWGDLNYKFAIGDSSGEPATTSGRLNGSAHSVEFSLPIAPGATTLTLTIESGEGGPIHDRVRLSRTLIAIGKSSETP